jgi:ABC-type Zn2+ transport system substrate-binding protein/surface adhesin
VKEVLLRAEALCKGKHVFCVVETATVIETSFLKILDNSKLHTHTHIHTHTNTHTHAHTHIHTHTHTHTYTHTVGLLYTSDQLVTQTANCTTHNKLYPCHLWDSNLRLQKSRNCNLRHRLYDHVDRPVYIFM